MPIEKDLQTLTKAVNELAGQITGLTALMETQATTTTNEPAPAPAPEPEVETVAEATPEPEVETVAETTPEPEPEPTPEVEPTTTTEEVTETMLRAKLRDLMQSEGGDTVAKIMKKFGAKRFPDIKEADYPTVYADVVAALPSEDDDLGL